MSDNEDYSKVATPKDHATSHQDGGSDEISVAALSGELADDQNSAWTKVSAKPTTFPPDSTLPHKASHEHGGADKIDLAGLQGKHRYKERGDPADYDMEVGDFYTNGDWHDIDLSLLNPFPYALIHLYVAVNDNLAHAWIIFREKGNSNVRNRSVIATQVAGITTHADIIVACDSSGVFEYMAQDTTFTDIWLCVKGWWML